MSKVFRENQVFNMAWLDECNPLPDIHAPLKIQPVAWDGSLTEEDVRWFNYGHFNSILPYQFQDNYTRDKKLREAEAVVLENEHVRAVFLPWMGGHLWSLTKDGRELLCKNPVVQPCNLALRNAWCSGGVEWNIGMRGHHMMTCSNMFTELYTLSDGTACVRFYEFERKRGVAYRVEAYLPPESSILFVQMTIENPADNGETPMYWWSNIAVPEGEGTRVVVPAAEAILTHYTDGRNVVSRVPVPMFEGSDSSYPTNIGHAVDFFYDIPKTTRKFITALKHGQRGLVQFSTDRLLGRKLFVWGMNKGGRHWQEFLADKDTAYVEIQAGLAHSQNEHIPMPAGETWTWLEGYTELTCDVDGLPFDEAGRRATAALDALYPQEELLKEQAGRAAEVAKAHGELIVYGSGWGALENKRRAAEGLAPLSEVCVFPEDSLTDAQKPWLALLDGAMTLEAPDTIPSGYMSSQPWRDRLEKAEKPGWNAWYQLAVARCAADDLAGAREALNKSIACEDNGWAWSALADIEDIEEHSDAAIAARRKALALLPENRGVFLRYGKDMLKAGLYQELLDAVAALKVIGNVPRVKAMKAAALIALARYDEARAVLLEPLIIPDMREGELSLGSLWDDLHMKEHNITLEEAREQYPLPYELDFRMH